MALSDKARECLVGSSGCVEKPLLVVQGLDVKVGMDAAHQSRALAGINFRIGPGEVVGILGESGAGKTTLALALLQLLPPAFHIVGGSVRFEDRALLPLSDKEWRKVRGVGISLIYQDSTVLNPVLRVGDQVGEVLRAHNHWTGRRRREEARALLNEVELEDIDRIYDSYPHQLSGGQRQRIVIAQALACRPRLVIADEPTSSLDPITASAIVELLGRLSRRLKMAFLIISHDIKILAQLADRVMVMYSGRIVEQGPTDEILQDSFHPYTRALLNCVLPGKPGSAIERDKCYVPTIAGSATDRPETLIHCAFESRCADRMPICARKVPKEVEMSKAHAVSCFKFGES